MPNNPADLFIYSHLAYEEQFKVILTGIVAAYQLMLKDYSEIRNHENIIRNILCDDYLTNTLFREKNHLLPFSFDAEPAVIKEGKEVGFIDIKVITTDTFFNQNDYYTIECKRLDGDYNDKRVKEKAPYRANSLATEYIENGIFRFVKKKYPTPFGVNGMIGFIVEQTDINGNIADINNLIKKRFSKTNTTQLLIKKACIKNFEFVYFSSHSTTDQIPFDLYHLMLDFSSIIK